MTLSARIMHMFKMFRVPIALIQLVSLTRRDSENGPSVCPIRQSHRQVFIIGTVVALSAKYSALEAYKILELFQY